MTLQRLAFCAAGALLMVGSLVPAYSLLRSPGAGLAGQSTADLAASAAAMMWGGTMLALAAGIAVSRVGGARLRRIAHGARAALMRPAGPAFAAACAFAGFGAALCIARFVFQLEPVLVDATAQLIHARHLLDGGLVAPPDTIGFFRTQQTVPAAGGWTSQYPPGHVVLLAAGMAAGAPWLVGPVMLGIALYCTARAVDLLLPGRASARAGIVAAALSPFMLLHAGSYMSHTTAAAFIGIALYAFALACRPGDASRISHRWAMVTGCAAGAAFATRPLTGVTIGLVLAGAVMSRTAARNRMSGLVALVAGAAPGVIAVMLYNARLFGSPFRFGYDVALGPAAGLGFGIDPWGNAYGVREALAYTSAELTSLSVRAFEAPFPWVAVIGLYLMSRTIAWSEAVLAAVILVPLAASLLYWHHGLFMGPRMLNEYGILWCVMAGVAAAGVIRMMPASAGGRLELYSPRGFAAGAVAAALVLALFLTPQRLRSLVQTPTDMAALAAVPVGATVFVHSTWADRAAMQLAARGWRLDQVETALRQNPTCDIQDVIDGNTPNAALSLEPRATNLPARVQLPGGSAVRVAPGEEWTPACARQVAADTAGVLDPAPFMWRGATAVKRLTIARDLGPEWNRVLTGFHPAAAYALVRSADGSAELLPNSVAMEKLWPKRRLRKKAF